VKKLVPTLLLLLVALAACQYDAPLTTDHVIPIDPSILGSWAIIPAENDDPETRVQIHGFSDTEYAIHYHESSIDLYFRAYAINIAGVPAVQLELIGSGEGAVGSDEEDRYVVARYRLVDGQLEVRTLNTELVDDALKDSESLRAAFIAHKDNPELFSDPGLFKRREN
jgi:hypothetical protein